MYLKKFFGMTCILIVGCSLFIVMKTLMHTETALAKDHNQRDIQVEEKSWKEAIPDTRYLSDEKTFVENSIESVMKEEGHPTKKVTATGYTAGIESTGKTKEDPAYGITYSGVPVTRDLYSTIAADPEVFPIGTVLYIPDYGFGVVADTGSAIKGNKIDLYYETVDDVYEHWGKQDTEVYVVEEGKGELTEDAFTELNESDTSNVFRSVWEEE